MIKKSKTFRNQIIHYIQKILSFKKIKKISDEDRIYKTKIKMALIAIIGFILSPLSWWNDIFVNIPLAYLFALLFSFISEAYFLPAIIIGYWITNIIGFILLHYGLINIFKKSKKKTKYSKKLFLKDIIVSIGYTVLVILLVELNILQLPSQYF